MDSNQSGAVGGIIWGPFPGSWTHLGASRGLIFGPLKSDLGVFWPFRGTDFIMGKNKNPNFSKRARQKILIFSLSSLFISVLKVPEEKLAEHNF